MQPKARSEEMEGEGGYAAACDLITVDAIAMAAHADCDKDRQAPYIDEYLDVLARNTYVRYRNGFLLALLDGLLRHPEQDWTLQRARRVSAAALAGNKLEFEQGLALAIQAIREKVNASVAGAALDAPFGTIRVQVVQAAQAEGDPWSMHLRRLAALGECLAGAGQHPDIASQCLTDVANLQRGYAGFRAPACLTLAEAVRITGLPNPDYYEQVALPNALEAANNVQEAIFCAQTTSRVNAMLRQWKTISAQEVGPLIRRFSSDPTAAEFAPIHVVGEQYGCRDTYRERTPLPFSLRDARSLQGLARYVYDRMPAEFLRLNVAHAEWDVAMSLKDDGTVEVRIPDPEFAPLLAARLAAEALAAADLLPHERVELIRLLVPVATSNPTALDTVLMRLLVAASYWLDPATLQKIKGSVDVRP